MPHNRQKKIAVINDFCGFGRCSLVASLPIISAKKIQCCPLPNSIFSNHTGFDSFFYTDYTENMTPYIKEWEKLNLSFEGILTGFLGSVGQIEIVKDFLKIFKGDKTVTVVDPVMGDNGKLYPTYSKELALSMGELLPFADILTPNLTEACILTDTEYKEDITSEELTKISETLSQMGPHTIVVSGIQRGEDLENFIYQKGKAPISVLVHKVGICRSGTGDVFSSLIAANAVNKKDIVSSVKEASDFIAKVLKRTVELEIPATDGLCFEEFLGEL